VGFQFSPILLGSFKNSYLSTGGNPTFNEKRYR